MDASHQGPTLALGLPHPRQAIPSVNSDRAPVNHEPPTRRVESRTHNGPQPAADSAHIRGAGCLCSDPPVSPRSTPQHHRFACVTAEKPRGLQNCTNDTIPNGHSYTIVGASRGATVGPLVPRERLRRAMTRSAWHGNSLPARCALIPIRVCWRRGFRCARRGPRARDGCDGGTGSSRGKHQPLCPVTLRQLLPGGEVSRRCRQRARRSPAHVDPSANARNPRGSGDRDPRDLEHEVIRSARGGGGLARLLCRRDRGPGSTPDGSPPLTQEAGRSWVSTTTACFLALSIWSWGGRALSRRRSPGCRDQLRGHGARRRRQLGRRDRPDLLRPRPLPVGARHPECGDPRRRVAVGWGRLRHHGARPRWSAEIRRQPGARDRGGPTGDPDGRSDRPRQRSAAGAQRAY